MLKILDISKYQPIVDYAKAAKEINGVILRCGITYWGKQDMGRDEYFEQHYKGFKAQGVPVGVYYYSAADSVAVAEKEASFCLSLLKGKQFELPIYYDVENNERQGKLTRAQLTAITDAFCSRLHSAGYFVGYYSYTAWLQSKFDTAYLSSKYTLWKADYRVNFDKNIPCDMHQYTSGGKINGINGRVDLNNCYKDFTAIIKANGLNGFDMAPGREPISKEPIKLYIGFATQGDIKALAAFVNALQIKTEVTNSGYIITGDASAGDQLSIMKKCDELGIPCALYEEKPTNDCECSELRKVNAMLVTELAAKNKEILNLEDKIKNAVEALK